MSSPRSQQWPVLSRYDEQHLREISMPLGGIGTGSIGLGGRGQLTDWQLMSRPSRGWRPTYSHLLLSIRGESRPRLRVLEQDIQDSLASDSGATAVLAGLPRFRHGRFEASFPLGRVDLWEEGFPVSAAIEGFSPLIPGDTSASSLPFCMLTVTLKNHSSAELNASVNFLLTNFIGSDGVEGDLKGNVTDVLEVAGWRGLKFHKAQSGRDPRHGTFVLLSDHPSLTPARRWSFQGRAWGGEALGIIDSLLEQGFIQDSSPEVCPPSTEASWHSSLSANLDLPAGGEASARFLAAWHFPYRNLAESGWWSGPPGGDQVVRNYYARAYRDAADAAAAVIPRLDDYRARTITFVEKVVAHPAPHAIREAALFNLSVLKSPTCFRIEDGLFAAWEGCNRSSGCCHGSCTHVWNYETATLRLFPDLHGSMLESHLKYGITAEGAERFRLSLPEGRPAWDGAAADGQMGVIVRTYEQYLVDRDLQWLRQMYPRAKSMLEFAWVPDGWDADKDGVMEGSQHNTYDVEFFGPNPMCTVWYGAALTAVERMARLVGDEPFADVCNALWKRGREWVDSHLFNGHYYVQQVSPSPRAAAPHTALSGEYREEHPRFQVGSGCLIDQLVGQYRAHRADLGELLDRVHVKKALETIFQRNHLANFRDHYNNMRTFAANDESGTLICSYAEGERPAQPFPYWSECMTGFEYTFAALLLDYGMRSEGEQVAAAVRSRHNGLNRNPFNEPECGSYYARCMASWSLLEAWDASSGRVRSGFHV